MKMKTILSLAFLAGAWMTGSSAWAQHEGDHSYTNGICTIDGCTDKYQPAELNGDYYELGNAGNVEWFAAQVNGGQTLYKAKLIANIDFEGVTHTPIGHSTGQKYTGEFDGQNFEIQNLTSFSLTNPVGFFGYLRANSTDAAYIHNLVIAESCVIEGVNNVGGIAGSMQSATGSNNNSAVIRIENCVNKASVTSTDGVASGILGCGSNPYPKLSIKNCVNTGDITANGNKGSALCSWQNNADGTFANCLNLGKVKGNGDSKNLAVLGSNGGTRTITNCYDLCEKDGHISRTQGEQGTLTTTNPLTSGELCYKLNGDQTVIAFYQNLSTDPTPVPFGSSQVYMSVDQYCDGSPKGEASYSNTDGAVRDPHDFTTGHFNLYCSVCNAFDENHVTTIDEDGFYHLKTAADVEWFSHMVRDARHGAMNVKLDADIDFGGVADAHLPIGSSGQKFFGHFDGQGHRIIGMVLTPDSKLDNRGYDGNGFFGSVRGGGTDADGTYTNEVIIENLIIDKSCSIEHDNNFAAGVVAHINSRNDENSNIIIRNCGNEANVSTTGKNAAGILGCVEGTNVGLKLYNLWNKGNISGQAGESAAICAWTGQRNVDGEVDIEGCWNIGEVTGVDGNGYNMIRRNTNIKPRNIVDLCTTNAGNQGKVAVINTKYPISSGELCYLLNGDQSNIIYTQTLGTDEMPVYRDNTHSQVYQAGTVNCLGASVGSLTYNNVSGETIQLDHNINADWGMCDVCHAQSTFQAPELVDGYYEIKNAGNVEWFSAQVADGKLTINGKMMNDISFYDVENLHSPIGPNTANKYNGTFDGQGYRIKNMIINRPSDSNIGFFGFLRGNNANTTVKNLIIDSSCSISANNRVGGITGSYQNGGNTITLENVVNEASIHAKGQDAGGLIGGHESGGPTIIIKNCMNVGDVTSDHEDAYVGALCCYMEVGGGSKIENFLNLGTIGTHKGGNIGRHNIGDVTNLIDLSATTDKTQGVVAGLTVDDVVNGKVAYILSWYQKLGDDDYPMPFEKDGATVYRTGYERCDGADIAGTVYSNTDGTIETGAHDYNGTTGLCDNCTLPNSEFKSPVDGAYELGSVIDMVWFSAMVNNGNPAINGKLTTNIDFGKVENALAPIGTMDNKYTGTFDGQGNQLRGLVINQGTVENIGLFGVIANGAKIQNFVLDSNCAITGSGRVGLIGSSNGSGTVYLTNLGNEGTVTGKKSQSTNAAGIIGGNPSGSTSIQIDGCYSTGNIYGPSENAQIMAWGGSNSFIRNSWSISVVENPQNGRQFGRYGGDNHDGQYENCFTTYTENNTGLTFDTPLADFESGKVAYTINKNAGKQIFRQLLDTDDYPGFSGPEVLYVGDAGFTTFYDATNDWALTGDAQAYIGTLSGNYLCPSEIDDIPAGTAVIIGGTYYNKVSTTATADATGNVLKGSDGTVTGASGRYVLANKSSGVGFYPVSNPAITIPAGKAYLDVSGSDVKEFYLFSFEEDATGINSLTPALSEGEGAIYNLAGQRISKLQKGINIVNGKKVLF